MKTFSILISLLAAPVLGLACPNSSSCGMDIHAFDEVLYYKCSSGSYVTENGASEIAREVALNKVDVRKFKESFYSTCDFGHAKRVSLKAAQGFLDFSAYKSALYYRCTSGSYVTDAGAEEVGSESASGGLNADDFKTVFYKTCDYSVALEAAKQISKRQLSLSNYKELLYYRCTSGSYVSESGARDISLLVQAGQAQMNEFKNVFYRTCDFDHARQVALKSSQGNLDFRSYDLTLYYKCTSGSYVSAEGAMSVASKAAARILNVNTFKSVFYRTCNYDKAVEIACQ